MQDLRLVGVHDDGEHVVLVATDGGRYRLRVDEALRAAVRRDRARLGQLQIQMEAQLRPRDIQARIRAGESAEDVAAAGGLSLEHVRRYEGPVLAERTHVAGLARRTPFGRGAGAGTLDEVVVTRLAARAVDPDGARWDAWRQEDGAWSVQCEFVAGGRGRVARWEFDPEARVLSAQDDEARWLSEEEPVEPGPLPARRLVSVAGQGGRAGERVYDVEADGGVRTSQTDEILQALDAQRGLRPEQAGVETAEPSGTAPRVDALTADPPPAHPAASAPEDRPDRTVLPGAADDRRYASAGDDAGPGQADVGHSRTDPTGPEQTGTAVPEPGNPAVEAVESGNVQPEAPDSADVAAEQAASSPAEPAPGTEATPRRRNRTPRRGGSSAAAKRPSVPSWDDIMFGAKKD